ncbi:MAG: hypothetical protein PHY99_07995, partial [Bacteroidales bacterium]|nr:hypothetical protein [Bacteroidales bacterium]
MSRFLLILALVVCSGTLYAQKAFKASADALRQLKKVEQAMSDLDWNESKSLSERLAKRYPEWIEAWKIRAEVYQGSGDIKNSERALRHLVGLDSSAYPEAYRWIAEWSFQRGNYPDAAVNMKKY